MILTILGRNVAAQVEFKTCIPFTKSIVKMEQQIDDAENLDLVMEVYNLIVYTVRFILTRQVVHGFILKMKQLILMLILLALMILGLSSIKLN